MCKLSVLNSFNTYISLAKHKTLSRILHHVDITIEPCMLYTNVLLMDWIIIIDPRYHPQAPPPMWGHEQFPYGGLQNHPSYDEPC